MCGPDGGRNGKFQTSEISPRQLFLQKEIKGEVKLHKRFVAFPLLIAKMVDRGAHGLVNTGRFSHLFPTSAKQYTSGISNNVVDYVIVFRYPTVPPKGMSREDLSASISSEFQVLSSKLQMSNLLYQVREGADNGTLLVLVYCPWSVLKKHLYHSR